MRLRNVGLGLAALLCATAASAQTPTRDQVEDSARAYTTSIAAVGANDQFARWGDDLCASVTGLSQAEAQTVIDHVALRAREVGVTAGGAGCRPNLLIVFTPDSDRFAREIVEQRRDLLGYYSQSQTVTLGRDALDEFASRSRPIRWWHVAYTVTADGQRIGDPNLELDAGVASAAANPGDAAGMPGADEVAAGSVYAAEGQRATRSRGTRAGRETSTGRDLGFALVIVDTRRIEGRPSGAVADYVAMAALVQLNAEADMSAHPSVLNLFAAADAPSGMTAWDHAYLRALYATRRNASGSRQRADIVRSMTGALAGN